MMLIRIMRIALCAVASVAAALLFSSCDRNKLGPIDFKDTAPLIISGTLSPDSVNVDAQTPTGGYYTVSTTVSIRATDPDGLADIKELDYHLLQAGTGNVIASGPLSRVSGLPDTSFATFSAGISFLVSRADMGKYGISVYALDRNDVMSNAKQLTLTVAKMSTPPALSGPGYREITSSGDSTLFAVTVAAFDSNGIQHINHVTVRVLSAADTSRHELHDDGSPTSGDAFPGDGVYSGYVWVVPTGTLAGVVFEFSATNVSGQASAPLQRPVLNHPPSITNVDVPDSIQRPLSGTNLIPFHVTVADSDGLADIDSVYFRNFNATNPTNILMYDDGGIQHPGDGDAVAGDGIFTRVVAIDSTAITGPKEFHFFVVDRAGARDEKIHVITIY